MYALQVAELWACEGGGGGGVGVFLVSPNLSFIIIELTVMKLSMNMWQPNAAAYKLQPVMQK
jgi:hypothetical protein